MPDDIRFQTKPEIALQQLRQAVADGVPPGVALIEPAYGNDSKLRAGISELGLSRLSQRDHGFGDFAPAGWRKSLKGRGSAYGKRRKPLAVPTKDLAKHPAGFGSLR